jgi:hypothetical protein
MYFFEFPKILEDWTDGDYELRIIEYSNGLLNIYDPNGDYLPANYLYHWYVFFYPFSLIDMSVSVYIWDILRIISCYYVGKNITKITKNEKYILTFYVLTIIGYVFDADYGNNNFLVLLLLFLSVFNLQQNKKWLAGIFFALAAFKVTVFLFLVLLLLIKEIKLKDLIYFIVPLFILCLPYLIFPDLLFQFLENLFGSKPSVFILKTGNELIDFFISIYLIIWPAVQPPHLTYYGFYVLVILRYIYEDKISTEIKNEKELMKNLSSS